MVIASATIMTVIESSVFDCKLITLKESQFRFILAVSNIQTHYYGIILNM